MTQELIVIHDCRICELPQVHLINESFIMGDPATKIFQEYGITYNKEWMGYFTKHAVSHITSPKHALARMVLASESGLLINTVVEAALTMHQIDLLTSRVMERLKKEPDNDKFHKLMKNLTDLVKRKAEFIAIHHKISGKGNKQDLEQITLTEVAKKAGKLIGDEKVNAIRDGANKAKKSVLEYIYDEDYLDEMLGKADNSAKAKKRDDDDYEIVETND